MKQEQEYSEELRFIGSLLQEPLNFGLYVSEMETEYLRSDLIRKFWDMAIILYKETQQFDEHMILERMYTPEERVQFFPNEYTDLVGMLEWGKVYTMSSQKHEAYFLHMKKQFVKNRIAEISKDEVRRLSLGENMEEVQDSTQAQKYELQKLLTKRQTNSVGEVHVRTFDNLLDAINNKEIGKSTPEYGIPKLDEVTYGVQNSQFVVLGAQQGTGKSVFGLNFGLNMAKQGFSILYVSLEMGEDQLMKRIWSCMGSIPYGKLMKYDRDDALLLKVDAMQKQFEGLDFDLICDGGLKVSDIEKRLQKKKYDVVIVDYIQLMRGKGSGRYEIVSGVSNDLKLLAMKYEVGVIGLAQLNKDGQRSDRPHAHHLKDSSSLEQDAEVIMLLHRSQDNQDHNEGKGVDMYIDKNRNGRSGVKLSFQTDYETMRVLGVYESF